MAGTEGADAPEVAWIEWLSTRMAETGRTITGLDVVVPSDAGARWRIAAPIPHQGPTGHLMRSGRRGCMEAVDVTGPSSPPGSDAAQSGAIMEAAHRLWRRTTVPADPETRPAWTVLTHPLIIAACLSIDGRREALPVDVRDRDRMPRWSDADLAGVGLTMDDDALLGMVKTGETVLEATRTSMAVYAPSLPLTMLSTLQGAFLSLLAALPVTGDADIDAAVASLRMTDFADVATGVMRVTLAPVRWKPYGVPPDAWSAEAMDAGPLVI